MKHRPALLLHVHRPLPPASRAGRRQRGRRWAGGGRGTPGRNGRRSDATSCTRPSAAPRRSAAAPGGSLTQTEQCKQELLNSSELND